MPGYADLVESVRSGKVQEMDLWDRLSDEERQGYLAASKQMGWDAAPLYDKSGGIPPEGIMAGLGLATAKFAPQIAGVVSQAAKAAGPMIMAGGRKMVDVAGTAIPYVVLAEGLKKIGLSPSSIDAIMIGMGLSSGKGGGSKPAPSKPPVSPIETEMAAEDAALSSPSSPTNLTRYGNVTNPGPNGTGSPSVPSGPTPNPLSVPRSRGPMGNEDNWSNLPSKTQTQTPNRGLSSGEENGISELDRFLKGVHGPDYPVKGNGQYPSPPPNKTSLRTPPSILDETDKRKVMFGGASVADSGQSFPVKPQDRSPMSTQSKTVTRRKPK